MKTKEELNALKKEVGALNKKLAELTEEELKDVAGGVVPTDDPNGPILNLKFQSPSKQIITTQCPKND